MTEAIVFKASADNADLWRREIAARVPDLAFRVWPDCGDPDEVAYLLLFRAEPGMFARFRNLKAVLCTGAGVDGVLSEPSLPPNVPVARIVDPWMTTAMGQWVVQAVLHHFRKMPAYAEQQRRAEWRELEEWSEIAPRVGILGCGEIGGFAGRILAELGFEVAGWTRSPRDLGPIRNHAGEAALPGFLARSDYLACLLPLTPATTGLLDARFFAMLPKGACLVNAARGRHVVQPDLLAALDGGQLDAAYLDVTDPEPLPADSPLWSHPRITITPHVAGVTNPYTAAAQVAENIRRAQAGEPMLNLVDRRSGY